MELFSKWSTNDKSNSMKLLKQFAKFGVVGVSNTLISLAIYYLFVLINPRLYILGNTAGFFLGVLNSYYWNSKYVFRKTVQGHIKPLLKTYVAYGITFVLSTILLFLLVDILGVSEFLAPMITLCVTIPINFLINKFWAFK